MANKIKLPEWIEGYGAVTPYAGLWGGPYDAAKPQAKRPPRRASEPKRQKLYEDLDSLLDELDLHDGMTVSFHHHLRNGDFVLNEVMLALQKRGLKNLRIAPSSLFPCHGALVPLLEDGTITDLHTDYMSGPLADAVSEGKLKHPAVMTSHGGRPRAILEGDLPIDIAFIAAPGADVWGNLNGVSGPSACGSLGYAHADAQCAACVVAVTDHLEEYPLVPTEIPQHLVDYVLKVERIGDPRGIVSGTTQITKDPIGLKIARDALKVLAASQLLKDGLSFQTGAGGISLAVAKELEGYMQEHRITGSFASGGITGSMVQMMEKGLFRAIYDVQCFDLEAVRSYRENANHMGMSGDLYANPHNKGAVVNNLDIVILGATEMDEDFNVNVTTGSGGRIMGGSGGHADTAAGARLTVIVSKLVSARIPLIKDRVTTVTTPGESVDVLVTDRGIAVNPLRKDLWAALEAAGLPLYTMAELKAKGEALTGRPSSVASTERIVAVVEYRDGTVIDVVRKIAPQKP
ncbi:Citrate lyase alpha chain [Clostridiaceae bacterium JG1575]|nr:Citrate lyase alpha chain [Clostridiaceae bacterium JG1575]